MKTAAVLIAASALAAFAALYVVARVLAAAVQAMFP